MPFPKTEKIWHNGKFINWDDAKIHVLSHVISYGSAVFEGIRCYETPNRARRFSGCATTCSGCRNSAYIYRIGARSPWMNFARRTSNWFG